MNLIRNLENMDIEEIIENFQFLDDWDDRYKYLIELGNALPEFAVEKQIAENKVQGCVSQVWVTCEKSNDADPILTFQGQSDAHIVSGLVAITFAIFSGKTAKAILETNEKQIFDSIDLSEHITPQRSNGLTSLVERIKLHARMAA
jgi:cysteine desulfuration protein SufE